VNLLLDTHIWLWSLLDPSRLTQKVARALESDNNELWISPISLWEVLVLAEKGRVSLKVPSEEWIANALSAVPLKEAPITNEVAMETGRFHLPHRDPADRFLVATARVFDLILVTADRQIITAKAAPVLANQ
jgi:PIN domain nuclease of toxin-antitoxin system